MGAAIGGRLTVTGAITIHTLRRIVALIGVTVTTMELLTMTTTRELMAGKRVRMARMARRQQGRDTILTPGLTREVLGFRPRTGAEVLRRLTTLTQELMLRPGKVRARMLNGVAPMFREETKVLPWAITQRPTEL